MEIYLNKGSTGGCANFMVGLSRMISLAARAGVGIYDIVDQLQSTGVCPSYASRTAVKHDTSKGSCCPMAVGNALIDMWQEYQWEIGEDVEETVTDEETSTERCPECGEYLRHEGGCIQCPSCGWSKCN